MFVIEVCYVRIYRKLPFKAIAQRNICSCQYSTGYSIKHYTYSSLQSSWPSESLSESAPPTLGISPVYVHTMAKAGKESKLITCPLLLGPLYTLDSAATPPRDIAQKQVFRPRKHQVTTSMRLPQSAISSYYLSVRRNSVRVVLCHRYGNPQALRTLPSRLGVDP